MCANILSPMLAMDSKGSYGTILGSGSSGWEGKCCSSGGSYSPDSLSVSESSSLCVSVQAPPVLLVSLMNAMVLAQWTTLVSGSIKMGPSYWCRRIC